MVTRRWEWCSDALAPYPETDDTAWRELYPVVERGARVFRGGQLQDLVACAIARGGNAPDFAHPYACIRLAQSI